MFENNRLTKTAGLLLCLLLTSACSSIPTETNVDDPATISIQEEVQEPTQETTSSEEFIPAGVLVDPGDESSLLFFDAEGNKTAELNTPGKGAADNQHTHLAGAMTDESFAIPVIYNSWDADQALMVTLHNDMYVLRASQYFYALAGAAGQSAMAFAEVVIEGNAPHSYLYAGNLDSLDSAAPFYDQVDETTQMALRPVAVTAIENNPQGVWYTKSAWGIGGADLVFDITRGLYYYDLITGDHMQYMDPERNFQGISPDLSMIGSIDFDFEGDRSMTAMVLNSRQSINFPLRSGSDRGAGYAVFAHDNQHLAWLEASGSFMDQPASYRSVVRIGDLSNGSVAAEIEDSTISQYTHSVSFMKPVGWLNNATLLIQVHGDDWGQTSLMAYNLADNTLAHFCDGSFVGFAY